MQPEELIDTASRSANTPGRRGPIRAVDSLRHSPQFRLLWVSNLFFFGGVWTQTLILGWMVFESTRSEFLIALFTAVRLAPMLLGPLAGVLSDRFDRQRLLVVACFWALLAVVAVAILAFLGMAPYWVLVAGGLIIGLAQSPSQPARSSLVLELVGRENLSNANALNAMAMNMTQMIGPAVGGAMISLVGAPAALAISAGWYAVSLLTLLPLKGIGSERTTHPESVWRMLTSGFETISRNRLTTTVLLITLAANVLIWPIYQTFMPVFADETLHLDAAGLGALLMCCGLGGVVGSIVIAMLGDFKWKGALFVIGTAIWSALWALFTLSHTVSFSFALMGAIGLVSAPFSVLQTTLILTTTPPEVQGRALGLQELAIGAIPVASLGLGAAAQLVGVGLITLLSALLLMVWMAVISLLVPQLLRYHGTDRGA
ncbi:MFS transporter [Specibacter cremeus]|uniref:MFS transporter n=1 Tax=Specibacter cremeus TaxID=1629051 RepID=UPI000F78AF76|nr:MFS transporter [Specibacter cremeus]